MVTPRFTRLRISWRWLMALTFFAFAMIGFSSGVSLTERPYVVEAPFITQAYYSLGLFVVGGLDIGTPTGGPMFGRALLWIAYFGSPLLAASAVVEAVLATIYRRRWHLRRVREHIVIVGSGDITTSYMRLFRRRDTKTPVIIVDTQIDSVREAELSESYDAIVVVGDITHEFLLHELRLHHAKRVLLLGDNDFLSFEAASKMFRLYPNLIGKIIIHCTSLRFLRAMHDTQIARSSTRFNSYNLAARGLVRDTLLDHFKKTPEQDTVLLIGFGLFGQTILEELEDNALDELDHVVLLDIDAFRRLNIVEEQHKLASTYTREVYEGNISHPDIWRQVTENVDLSVGEPVLIFGTGDSASNLRTAIWVKQKYPNALVFCRTNDTSEFALQVGMDHDLECISITDLVEKNIPEAWLT